MHFPFYSSAHQLSTLGMRVAPIVATLAVVSALAVIDGDTFRIGAERYRLLGIDAAEIHRAQCDAEAASAS
jgi:endonuclease YncB( thermonuclease family)